MVWFIVKNKNTYANMKKQLLWSIRHSWLLHRNSLIVIQKQYIFSGNMVAINKLSKHMATYCNKLLLHKYNKYVTVKTI